MFVSNIWLQCGNQSSLYRFNDLMINLTFRAYHDALDNISLWAIIFNMYFIVLANFNAPARKGGDLHSELKNRLSMVETEKQEQVPNIDSGTDIFALFFFLFMFCLNLFCRTVFFTCLFCFFFVSFVWSGANFFSIVFSRQHFVLPKYSRLLQSYVIQIWSVKQKTFRFSGCFHPALQELDSWWRQ